jgi:hypothetical protein
MKKSIHHQIGFVIGVLITLTVFVSCGPSLEEIEAREKTKVDSAAAVNALLEKQKIETENALKIAEEAKKKRYFLANQFDLIPGTIVGWAPTDETINKWEYNQADGKEPKGKIYVHIQDSYGMVTVLPCSYRAWLNLHTGDVLR